MDGRNTEPGYQTRDSGVRAKYASGMVRDSEEGKARFDLLFPENVPYGAQMMTRFADLMARGAKKYDARNWEKARGAEELARYRSSAIRHLAQWEAGETDEDHAAAVMFNLMAAETVKWKMTNLPKPEMTLTSMMRTLADVVEQTKQPLLCLSRTRCPLFPHQCASLLLSHDCILKRGHKGKHWDQGYTCIPLGHSWADFEVC